MGNGNSHSVEELKKEIEELGNEQAQHTEKKMGNGNSQGVEELKKEIEELRNEQAQHTEKISDVESSVAAAHKQLAEQSRLQKKIQKNLTSLADAAKIQLQGLTSLADTAKIQLQGAKETNQSVRNLKELVQQQSLKQTNCYRKQRFYDDENVKESDFYSAGEEEIN